jgi:PTH1 family peptidyl-tRNA hydrolase
MTFIFGLGNPGKKYKNTPHNAGFLVLDEIAKILNVGEFKQEFASSLFIKTNYNGEDIFLVKPQTYMNNSGLAVSEFKNFYKTKNENIIVVHDDIDLPFGKIKQTFNSGSAGHKGVQSIIDSLGAKNFYRVKIGVCPMKKPENLEDYVIKKIPQHCREIFFDSIVKAAQMTLSLCNTSRTSL